MDFQSIPNLDLTRFPTGSTSVRKEIAVQLRRHLETTGFLYISGHGINEQLISEVSDANKRFHQLPLQVKNKLALNKNFRGYIPINTSTIVTSSVQTVTKPNQSASMMIMHEVAADDPMALSQQPLQGPNLWPDDNDLPGFRSTIETYVIQMKHLCETILDAIEIALDLPKNTLQAFFDNPTTFLRLLHYPSQRHEAGLYGSAPHTDYGFITLLAQDDVGGLEVRNRAGKWIAAPPVAGTFVMNVGDILARWSNNIFVSTPHRVINISGNERYSQPFFYDPATTSLIEVLPGCLNSETEAAYPPIIYGDYLMERINKNYQSKKDGS